MSKVRKDGSSRSVIIGILLGLRFCGNAICSGDFFFVPRMRFCVTKSTGNSMPCLVLAPHHTATTPGCSCEDRDGILAAGSFEDSSERVAERLHFVSGEMANVQYKTGLLRGERNCGN